MHLPLQCNKKNNQSITLFLQYWLRCAASRSIECLLPPTATSTGRGNTNGWSSVLPAYTRSADRHTDRHRKDRVNILGPATGISLPITDRPTWSMCMSRCYRTRSTETRKDGSIFVVRAGWRVEDKLHLSCFLRPTIQSFLLFHVRAHPSQSLLALRTGKPCIPVKQSSCFVLLCNSFNQHPHRPRSIEWAYQR